jgi:hypothetical protein
MSKVFDSQVTHYKQKFHETKDKLTKEAVLSKAKSFGYDSADELKKALEILLLSMQAVLCQVEFLVLLMQQLLLQSQMQLG